MSKETKSFDERVNDQFDKLSNPETPARDFHLRRTIGAAVRYFDEQSGLPEVHDKGYVEEYFKVPEGYIVKFDDRNSCAARGYPFAWYNPAKDGHVQVGGREFFASFLEAYAGLLDCVDECHGLKDAVRIAYAGAKALRS